MYAWWCQNFLENLLEINYPFGWSHKEPKDFIKILFFIIIFLYSCCKWHSYVKKLNIVLFFYDFYIESVDCKQNIERAPFFLSVLEYHDPCTSCLNLCVVYAFYKVLFFIYMQWFNNCIDIQSIRYDICIRRQHHLHLECHQWHNYQKIQPSER